MAHLLSPGCLTVVMWAVDGCWLNLFLGVPLVIWWKGVHWPKLCPLPGGRLHRVAGQLVRDVQRSGSLVPVTLASLELLKCAKLIPTPGPLHLWFPVPRVISPALHMLTPSFGSDFFSSVSFSGWPFLSTLAKTHASQVLSNALGRAFTLM